MQCFKCRHNIEHEPILDNIAGVGFGTVCETCDRLYVELDGTEPVALILDGEPTGKWRPKTALEVMGDAIADCV